jgi:hypothetical protein
VAEAGSGEAEMASEMREVLAADVAQFDALEVVPDALVRIEVGGVAGELFQADAAGTALGEEVLDRLAAMDGSAVPDDQELAGDVAEQVLQEADDIRALVGMVLHQHEQAPGGGDAADDRQVVAAQGEAEDRRLAARRVGADGAGEEVEARFVDPDDRPTLLVSPLFRAGQRSVRQASITASFRWLARAIGFCTLQPAARRSLPTWLGW